jgi:KDO2-lipid IV(A) lauroyltransferase
MLQLVIDSALWFFWFPLRKVVQFIPLKATYFLAHVCAQVLYLLAGKIRRRTSEELKRCLGKYYKEKEIRRITRRSFEMDVKRRFEELFLGNLTKETIEKMVSIEGLKNLEKTLVKNRGAIILLSHFGSFFLPLLALGFKGYKINQLGGPPILKNHRSIHRRIFEVRKDYYRTLPVTFIRTDKSILQAVKALKNNEIVAIAFDGREGRKWSRIKMFNREAIVSPGPIRIAMKTGAAIIPTFIIRNNNNTHRLIFESPFELDYHNDEEKMLTINLQRLAEIFEDYIKKYPCHYGMILEIMKERAQKGIIEYHLLPDESVFVDSF